MICLTYFLSLRPKTDSNGTVIGVQDQPGVTVKPYGTTPGTKTYGKSQCAADASQNLIPKLPNKLQGEGAYMQKLFNLLLNKGYRFGLTAQHIPYDWRKSYKESGAEKSFANVIQDMYEITGKKVAVFSHSLGNLVAYENLLNMTQESKDRCILRWFNVAGPMLGTVTAVRSQLGLPSLIDYLTIFFSNFGSKNIYKISRLVPSIF